MTAKPEVLIISLLKDRNVVPNPKWCYTASRMYTSLTDSRISKMAGNNLKWW